MKNGVYTIDEIKTLIMPVAQKYGIRKVILVGSYAREEATSESDIDLIIELPQDDGLFRFAEILNCFRDALSKDVNCLTESSVPPSVRFHTLDDEVILYAASTTNEASAANLTESLTGVLQNDYDDKADRAERRKRFEPF